MDALPNAQALPPPRIGGVCERDIDLLLLEEFIASRSFRGWFLEQIGLQHICATALQSADRSVTQSAGESDLELSFMDSGRATVILIENKIGAQLQPLQAERYCMRGDAYLTQGACARYHTVIIAPAAYFRDAGQLKGFQHRMTYEDLIDWFERAEDLGPRRSYKATLLRAAAAKGRLGYEPIADAGVTEFFQGYWDLVTALHPELGMRKPGGRPSGSGRVYFKTAELNALHADVAHKTGRGIVDLHLRRRGAQLGLVQAALGEHLEPGMSLEVAGKSAAVRLRVPVLDRTRPLQGQRAELEAGIRAAKHLADWAMRHREAISRVSYSRPTKGAHAKG